eukprot:SAG31_NODE_16737_length_698_cov_0.869783_1_plen_173_part_00
MIGHPTGLVEEQWLRSMKAEHCDVDRDHTDSKVWGASNRGWTTGNYKLGTTPSKEWLWVSEMKWSGKLADQAPGASPEIMQTTRLERIAVCVEELHKNAGQKIYAMLKKLAVESRPKLTEDEVNARVNDISIKKAEILALRLYTGKLPSPALTLHLDTLHLDLMYVCVCVCV